MVKGVSSGNLNIFCYVPVMKEFCLGTGPGFMRKINVLETSKTKFVEYIFGTNRRYSWQYLFLVYSSDIL